MTVRWEQRVRAALLTERGTPVATRLSAVLLIARIRLLRWTRRAVVALTAMVAVALVVAPAVAAAIVLARAF